MQGLYLAASDDCHPLLRCQQAGIGSGGPPGWRRRWLHSSGTSFRTLQGGLCLLSAPSKSRLELTPGGVAGGSILRVCLSTLQGRSSCHTLLDGLNFCRTPGWFTTCTTFASVCKGFITRSWMAPFSRHKVSCTSERVDLDYFAGAGQTPGLHCLCAQVFRSPHETTWMHCKLLLPRVFA